MTIQNNTTLKQTGTKWMLKILFYDAYFSPIVFFLFIIFKELDFMNNQYYTYWLFWSGVAFYLLTCINHFFFYSAVLSSSINIYFPTNIIIGLISSNKKWKVYLLWFVLSYYIPADTQIDLKQIFIIISSCVSCIQCFRELIFQNVRDNVMMFGGLFAILCVHVFNFFCKYAYQYQFTQIQRVCIAPILFLLGYGVIKARIKRIRQQNFINLKNPQLLIHYIEMTKKSLENVQQFHTYIHLHKQQCSYVQCYCSRYYPQNFMKMDQGGINKLAMEAINEIYLKVFRENSWGLDDKLVLMHRYAEFLIGLKYKPRAISILTHSLQQNMGYFNRCENYLVRQKLQQSIASQASFDILKSKLSYIYNYDLQVGYVNKQIRQIIQNKIQFWKELCKQNPRLKQLQIMGRKLVKRIQDLHQYFSYVIKPCQQSLSLIHGTILYASFLILTTNYSEFANSLAKKAQKMFDEKKGQLSNGSQFGMFLKVRQNYSSNQHQNYDLIIDNISTRLALILKQDKQKLINKYLTQLIPDQYRVIHNKRFDQFYKKSNINSCIIGNSIQLPFKVCNDQAIFFQTEATIRYDPIANCATVQCLIKTITNDAINFIVDLDGNLKYRESLLFQNYATHPTIKEIIINMKQEWKRSNHITQKQKKIQQYENIFTFYCQALHLNRMKQIGKQPLIRVIARNDNFRNQKLRIFNLQNTIRFKQVQYGIPSQNQNDSQTSTTSRKDSIQNVLSVLTQSNSLKTQRFLTITLLLLLIFAILSFNICINFFNIWSTAVKETSPTYTVISLINFKNIFNTAISWYYDVSLSQINPNMPLINTIYNNQTIQNVGKEMFNSFLFYQKNLLDTHLLGTGNTAKLIIKDAFDTSYIIQNPITLPNAQQMSLQSIIGNFIVDIYILYSGESYEDTMLSFVYLQNVYPQLSAILDKIINELDSQVHRIRANNIVLVIFVCILFLTFMIPIWKFNVSNKKKHEQIYNLLASIESKLIVDEIKKLMQIEQQVFAIFNSTQPKQNTDDNNIPSQFKINWISKCNDKKDKQINKQKDFFQISSGGGRKNGMDGLSYQKINQLPSKVRKRGGEVMIVGSDCDRKKFICYDWIVLFFILLFVAITLFMFWEKLNYITIVQNEFKQNRSEMSNLQDLSLALLNTKMYVDSSNPKNILHFEGENMDDWIKSWIINYNSENMESSDDEAKIKLCLQNILLCKLSISEKVIESVIKMSIADSYQQKYNLTKGLQGATEKLLEKSRFLLFFSQSLVDFLRDQKYTWSMNSFSELQIQQKQQIQNKVMFQSVFWLLIIIFCVFAILYANSIKKRYVKEVTLLSILNKEMIYNNKRVESFVHSLSKGSR